MKQTKIKEKTKDFLGSNQGFTFVELLTSITIFSIFVVALMQFMNTAAFMSKKINGTVNLGMQSTVALGMIEEYIVDCSGMVEFDGDTLYIVNNTGYDSTDPMVYIFELDENTLYFNTAVIDKTGALSSVSYSSDEEWAVNGVDRDVKVAANPGTSFSIVSGNLDESKREVLSKNVDSFDVILNKVFVQTGTVEETFPVTPTPTDGSDTEYTVTYPTGYIGIQSVDVEFQMSQGAEQYTGNSFISLRNKPYDLVLGNKPVHTIT